MECMAYIVADEQAMEIVGDEIKTALIGTIEHSSESRLTLDACRPLSVCLSRNDSTPTTFSNSCLIPSLHLQWSNPKMQCHIERLQPSFRAAT